MTTLYINDYINGVYNYESKERYGPWEQRSEYIIAGILAADENNLLSEITVDFPVIKGDNVYVLHITYSEGDSFGNSFGNGDIVWIFTDLATVERVKEEYKVAKKPLFVFHTESGKEVSYYRPDYGYFSVLERIEITPFVVG